jgi:hypothetical protein
VPASYEVRKLREYDRNIFRGSSRASDRVLETVPFCWLCPATTGQRTREHVFAQRLLREFPPELTRFEPVRYTSMFAGGLVGSHRGPFPGTALVAGAVCASCNNGWMSQLETDARAYLLGQEALVAGEAVATLARWFAKTAIVINVSQPYRLLWHNTHRHQVRDRVPDNLAISLYRVSEPDVNWAQGSSMLTHSVVPAEMDTFAVSKLTGELTHLCRIQVGTLVGTIVAFPWQLAASTLTMPGQMLWSHGAGFEVDLSALPLLDKPFGDAPSFDVEPSAFWAGTGD